MGTDITWESKGKDVMQVGLFGYIAHAKAK